MSAYNHVLLIDDNEVDNYLTERVIAGSDFANKIDTCTSGQKALDYLRSRFHDLEQIPNIIFLDINMPVVDGFVFLFEWEDFPVEVKNKCEVVVLSSMLHNDIIDKITNDKNVKEFIPKPLSQSALKRLSRKPVSVFKQH